MPRGRAVRRPGWRTPSRPGRRREPRAAMPPPESEIVAASARASCRQRTTLLTRKCDLSAPPHGTPYRPYARSSHHASHRSGRGAGRKPRKLGRQILIDRVTVSLLDLASFRRFFIPMPIAQPALLHTRVPPSGRIYPARYCPASNCPLPPELSEGLAIPVD